VSVSIRFGAIRHELGETSLEVASLFPGSEELIERTGIPVVHETRRSALALAAASAAKTLDAAGTSRIGALILVTQSADSLVPGLAQRLQHELSLDPKVLAFDVSQGCSGFVQAVTLASRLAPDFGDVLVVTVDTYRSKLREGDRSTRALFSDAAASVVVSGESPTHRIVAEQHWSEGGGANLLHQPIIRDHVQDLEMNGREVFLFTRRVVPELLEGLANSAARSLTDFDVVFSHQASGLVLTALQRDLADAEVELPRNLHTYGNTVSSSIPILLEERWEACRRKSAILVGFGVGLSAAAIALEPVP
jgi:3-oxoacyl-[acyl-carrier-protein] synthase-3